MELKHFDLLFKRLFWLQGLENGLETIRFKWIKTGLPVEFRHLLN